MFLLTPFFHHLFKMVWQHFDFRTPLGSSSASKLGPKSAKWRQKARTKTSVRLIVGGAGICIFPKSIQIDSWMDFGRLLNGTDAFGNGTSW